ncbi:MAG: divalent-cation tolerance protein CutA [Rhodobacteraceae bacterium]|nr:divalent-cation tolerance protein CutA [Paracoccaceae bacterium]TVR47763.1 MAG: divalent-cation tolerance protein CutA [Paracoccaceae bacterium]
MKILEVEVTCPDAETAQSIARACLTDRLVACANLLHGVESLFRWQGQIDSETEVILRMKARAMHFDAVCRVVGAHHPYDLPAIIALPVNDAAPGVADWVAAETQDAKIAE